MPYRGWESVTVPGVVAGWVSLSDKFGKLPFQDLFVPAVGYAESGFAVSPIIAQQWSLGAAELSDQPGFADNFLPKEFLLQQVKFITILSSQDL